MIIFIKNTITLLKNVPLSIGLILGLALPFFTACNVEQFLQKDQHIVRKNAIEIRNVKIGRASCRERVCMLV